MSIVMDNNELVDSSILYNHAMDNCEHIDTSAEDDNVNCCKKEFFPASSVSVFFRQIVLHKNLALVVDICGEHLVKMGKLFSFFCTHAMAEVPTYSKLHSLGFTRVTQTWSARLKTTLINFILN